MRFEDQLYELRRRKGLSQEQLASLCNVSRQAVSKWENGTANPDLNNLKVLASVLEVSVDELLGIESDSEGREMRRHYSKEYTSSLRIGNIPLVHICIGWGRKRNGKRHIAKGIIAIGNVSIGVVSIGIMSAGIISFGILTFGLLFALGCLSLSYLAVGALAIGYIAIGAFAVGVYSIGAISIGFVMSIGAISYGTTAIGPQDTTFGETVFYLMHSSAQHGRSCVLSSSQLQKFVENNSMPYLIEFILQHIPPCH